MASLAVKVQVKGLEELDKKLNGLPDSINRELKKAVGWGCAEVEFTAIDNVRRTPPDHPQVQTGRLMDSIMTEVTETADGVVGRVGTNTEYAPYLEYGYLREGRGATHLGVAIRTDFVGPYPFLGPALHENKDAIRERLEDAIRDAIEKEST